MKQINNKKDFFSYLKSTFYPGDMLLPLSNIISHTNWMIYKLYGGEDDISENEISEWIHKFFKPFIFEGVECIRAFRRDIPADNCKSANGQIGILTLLCSFEVAVMLKKLEYNESCSTIYQKAIKSLNSVYVIDCITDYPAFGPKSNYPAADLLTIQDWLRQKYGIIVKIDYDYEDGFIYSIISLYKKSTLVRRNESTTKYYTSYYALNAGILKALSIILECK